MRAKNDHMVAKFGFARAKNEPRQVLHFLAGKLEFNTVVDDRIRQLRSARTEVRTVAPSPLEGPAGILVHDVALHLPHLALLRIGHALGFFFLLVILFFFLLVSVFCPISLMYATLELEDRDAAADPLPARPSLDLQTPG